MHTLGIDLGTTNTVAAVADHVFALSDDGRSTLPSTVAFLPDGMVQVGESARRRRAIDGRNTIYSSKRIIGRRWDDAETQYFRDLYPFALVEEAGLPTFETRAGRHCPGQIATLILEAVFSRVKSLPGEFSLNITTPAAFGAAPRRATLAAAERAGFQHVQLTPEPLATALAYLTLPRDTKLAVVYDLGGGTFDCAVLDCATGTPEMIAHSSDLFLGGNDIDHELAAWVATHVLEKHNWDLTNYSETYDRLLLRCEEAKLQLSHESEIEIELSQIDPECPAAGEAVTITARLLDDLCVNLIRRSFQTCDAVLREAGLKPRDIDSVFLAGGTTLLPAIQHGVRNYFGTPGLLEFDPMEVVARGACLGGPRN